MYVLENAVESHKVTLFPHAEWSSTTREPSAMKGTERPIGSCINHSQIT